MKTYTSMSSSLHTSRSGPAVALSASSATSEPKLRSVPSVDRFSSSPSNAMSLLTVRPSMCEESSSESDDDDDEVSRPLLSMSPESNSPATMSPTLSSHSMNIHPSRMTSAAALGAVAALSAAGSNPSSRTSLSALSSLSGFSLSPSVMALSVGSNARQNAYTSSPIKRPVKPALSSYPSHSSSVSRSRSNGPATYSPHITPTTISGSASSSSGSSSNSALRDDHARRTTRYGPDRDADRRARALKRFFSRYLKNTEGTLALIGIISILIILLLILFFFIYLVPVFMFCMVLCLTLSLLFIFTENNKRWIWHQFREAENRFWSLLAFIFTCALFFTPDSPLFFLGWNAPLTSCLIVLLAVFYASHYDRMLARASLSSPSQLPRVRSFVLLDKEAAKMKLRLITESLKKLDQKYLMAKVMKGDEIRKTEEYILEIMKNATADELNYIITNANLAMLFYKVKDKDVFILTRVFSTFTSAAASVAASAASVVTRPGYRASSPTPSNPSGTSSPISNSPKSTPQTPATLAAMSVTPPIMGNSNNNTGSPRVGGGESVASSVFPSHRTQLLSLLIDSRLPELSCASRVCILDALMRLKLSAHPRCEQWVRDIILQTRGVDLLKLKMGTDSKGRAQNLHKLIFKDIVDVALRQQILEHIRTEGEKVLEEERKTGHRRIRRKILSDVDDTLMSSGGRYPAGVDATLPHHALYPGVLSFYRELDVIYSDELEMGDELLLPDSAGAGRHSSVGNLVFLSARPHFYKDKTEIRSYKLFEALRAKGMHCSPTLLAGNLRSGIKMFSGDFFPIGRDKFKNFCEFLALYNECSFVFVGDNGQADVLAAEMMREKFGDKIEAVFIHAVQPIHKTPGFKSHASIDAWKKNRIFFFRTYVEAACIACQENLIELHRMRRIALDAVKFFKEETIPQLLAASLPIEDKRIELNRDLESVNAYLSLYSMPSVAYVECEQSFAINAQVVCPVGVGYVRAFRKISGMYEIELTSWTVGTAEDKAVTCFCKGDELSWYTVGAVGSPVATTYGSGVLQEIRNDGVHVVWLDWGSAAYLQPNQILRILPAALGDQVRTPYGLGTVITYRNIDNIYSVALHWGSSPTVAASVANAFTSYANNNLPNIYSPVHSSAAASATARANYSSFHAAIALRSTLFCPPESLQLVAQTSRKCIVM